MAQAMWASTSSIVMSKITVTQNYDDSLLKYNFLHLHQMAGLNRIVVPGVPYHVTQRGNGRQSVFFEEGATLSTSICWLTRPGGARTEIWSYCLMPNHVHIVLVPTDPDGLRRTFGDLHRRYTGYINARRRSTGHLWQGRYGSLAMDEAHVVTALRYVALNPVRTCLAARAEDWRWPITRALLAGRDDHVVTVALALERVGNFATFLGEPFVEALSYAALRKAESVGRPIGSPEWLADMERRLGRRLAPQKRGPKPESAARQA
jgi:putative transposase